MPQSVIVDINSGEIKSLARSALKGAWHKVFLCELIVLMITSYIPAFLSATFPALDISYTFNYEQLGGAIKYSFLPYIFLAIFNGPLRLGFCGVLLRLIRERAINVKEVLSGFKRFFKAFIAQVVVALVVCLGSLPILFLVTLLAAFLMRIGGALVILGSAVASLGMIFGIVIAAILFLFCSLTFFILSDNPGLSATAAVRHSARLMRYNVGRLLALRISYLGWGIAAFIISYSLMTLLQTAIPNGGVILNIIANLPIILFTIYMDMGDAFFYEFATGHLRKMNQAPNYNMPVRGFNNQ